MSTNTYELQRAVGAAARASGHPVLDAGRGQPNWTVTEPRAGFFRLGAFAVDATAASSALDTANPYWGTAPSADGLAKRLAAELADDPSPGARFLAAAVQWAQDELGFDGDAWVGRARARRARGRLPVAEPDPAARRAGAGGLPRRHDRCRTGPARPVPALRHRGRRGRDGLRLPHAAGEPAAAPRRPHRDRHADLHPVPGDPAARRLRVRRRGAAVGPLRRSPLRRARARRAARPDHQGLLRREPRQPGLPRHAHRAPGPAARPGAARPAGPAGHRGHRLRDVRRRLPRAPSPSCPAT